MITKLLNWGIFGWLKGFPARYRRYISLKEIKKSEKLWDMRLGGRR